MKGKRKKEIRELVTFADQFIDSEMKMSRQEKEKEEMDVEKSLFNGAISESVIGMQSLLETNNEALEKMIEEGNGPIFDAVFYNTERFISVQRSNVMATMLNLIYQVLSEIDMGIHIKVHERMIGFLNDIKSGRYEMFDYFAIQRDDYALMSILNSNFGAYYSEHQMQTVVGWAKNDDNIRKLIVELLESKVLLYDTKLIGTYYQTFKDYYASQLINLFESNLNKVVAQQIHYLIADDFFKPIPGEEEKSTSETFYIILMQMIDLTVQENLDSIAAGYWYIIKLIVAAKLKGFEGIESRVSNLEDTYANESINILKEYKDSGTIPLINNIETIEG